MSTKPDPPVIAPLDITATIDADEVRIALTGEIDVSNAHQVFNCTDHYLNEPQIVHVTADLADLTFIDSCGLRALLLSRRHADQLDKTFRIQNQSEHIAKVIEVTGLAEYLNDPTYQP